MQTRSVELKTNHKLQISQKPEFGATVNNRSASRGTSDASKSNTPHPDPSGLAKSPCVAAEAGAWAPPLEAPNADKVHAESSGPAKRQPAKATRGGASSRVIAVHPEADATRYTTLRAQYCRAQPYRLIEQHEVGMCVKLMESASTATSPLVLAPPRKAHCPRLMLPRTSKTNA